MKKIERAFDLLSRFTGNQEQCDIFNDARAELEEFRERLRGIEQVAVREHIHNNTPVIVEGVCPACKCVIELDGHDDGCWLAKWINGGE